MSAAFAGAGLGLGLGALFMMGGLGRAVVDHSRAARIAEVARGGFTEAVLRRETAAMGPGAAQVLKDQDNPLRPARSPADLFAAGNVLTAREGTPDPVRDLDCLTQAVYFEARGETPKGQAAIAQVVLNRVKHPAFPKTVCAVVFQGAAYQGGGSHGCQFSFACDGSMHKGREADAWDRARHVAARALAGAVLADVGSATHFHTTGVSPDWGPRMLKVAQVGLHIFYRVNPHARDLQPADVEQAVFVSQPAPSDSPPTIRLASALLAKPADVNAAVAASLAGPAPSAPLQPAASPEPKPTTAKPSEPPAALTKTSGVPVKTPPASGAAVS